MTITEVEFHPTATAGEVHSIILLHTDDGITGVGEIAISPFPQFLNWAIEAAKPLIEGSDPFNWAKIRALIAAHGKKCSAVGVFNAVRNGVEAACLDIMGKQLRVPAYQFLGGVTRQDFRVCATGWWSAGDTTETCARKIEQIVSTGFTALELDPFRDDCGSMRWSDWERAIEFTRKIRETVGSGIDLIVDAKGRFAAAEGICIAEALDPLGLLYVQDPVSPGDLDALEALRKATKVPMAVGSQGWNGDCLRQVVEGQLADFLHLDCLSLGISQAREFALLAESWFMNVTLHHEGGPTALALNTEMAAATPNCVLVDLPYAIPEILSKCLLTSIKIENGCFEIGTAPGLGIDCDALLEHALVRARLRSLANR